MQTPPSPPTPTYYKQRLHLYPIPHIPPYLQPAMNTRIRRSTNASGKGGKGKNKGKGGGERSRAPSLRDVYLKKCAESGIPPNSAVIGLLPDKAGAAFGNEVLDVSSNYLGDKGVVPLLAAVERMTELRAVVLTENGLRNKAIEALCAVAAKHPTIEYIDVSDNFISEGAARSLEKLLRANPHVVEVVVEHTKIDVEWRVKLKDLIAVNRALANEVAAAEPNHQITA